ncbi:putative membrane protein [Propionispora sp. 2/2-37]|uniref:PilN domain-containing protein n=1 Tax=Propionispora sp. 2/2-37 TaxID=1677858 RepID=UPI0006BB69D9|nr:PilN domain-containing protein [Propionispora sp. 2/2-37]CUH94093.1 putative membrane protein [Propionispora sp. 2/2-37]
MIRVNLLPPEKRPSGLSFAKISVTIIVVSLSVCLLSYSYYEYVILDLKNHIMAAENQQELFRPLAKERVKADKLIRTIRQKEAVLLTLTRERKPWNALIDRLTEITPQKVWFTQIGMDGNKNDNVIKIHGIALQHAELAELLSMLEQDPFFLHPVLTVGQFDFSLTVPVVRFEISMQIRS